ncbi:DUF72 domain-containing protein [Paenibacillus sp.]|uniref:DUF72 domain-containing protein n=1 Tax=Paenibacillus sp. TaxID=58172 RepID=UPI002D7386BE|nr:DUF72 domain-containing protein [Paenibacillus sp.]HZG58565.1 DUF72 domain-containing protein [Paenibacillus sp.]
MNEGFSLENVSIGLAGWGGHDTVYPAATPAARKLAMYARQFPVVEVDNSFYAIPTPEAVQRWVDDTPDDFGFVVKAFQGMTGHDRDTGRRALAKLLTGEAAPSVDALADVSEAQEAAMFAAFRAAFEPMARAGKLRAILFQYPPWFDCTRDNVATLRRAKALMADAPVALEFRHQSWFAPEFRAKTLSFMEREGWMHSVCDEPQAGLGSIPIVPVPTHPERTIVRFHGRNVAGWHASGSPDWRAVRYLYDYSDAELRDWVGILQRMLAHTAAIDVIFNNNSGGHGAGNAKRLMTMLGQSRGEPPPEQISLF